jgi:hypothetical protein
MTVRLFFVTVNMLLSVIFFWSSLWTEDQQSRQTRLLFAIYFSLGAIGFTLGAIALHTGAYPLWNNR